MGADVMGLFSSLFEGECRPPNEFNSRECYERWVISQSALMKPSVDAKKAIFGSQAKNKADEFEAVSQMNIAKASDNIDKAREKLKNMLLSLAKRETGPMGLAKGEFAGDTSLVTTPKSRKVAVKISPTIQIAGLESKAVAAGLPQRFYSDETTNRPI